MEIGTCPHCHTRVAPRSDNTCPSCNYNVDQPLSPAEKIERAENAADLEHRRREAIDSASPGYWLAWLCGASLTIRAVVRFVADTQG